MAIALYARKSIEREGSISCETQFEYCKSRILPEEREEKIEYYKDNGFSGGNMERDAFQSMMKNIEKGKISKVIIYRLDRISRSLTDFVSILNTFKKYHVSLVSTQESFDTASPYGDMIVKILMIFAEFERNSIIARVTQAYAHRSELGLYMGGRRPYGFALQETYIHNIKTKEFVAVSAEIAQVKRIFEDYATEGMTLGRLQNDLIDQQLVAPNEQKTHTIWSTAKLSTILKNPIYVKADSDVYDYYLSKNVNIISLPTDFDGIHGLQLYGKTKHNSQNGDLSDVKAVIMTHEGIVDSAVWLKCQQKLARNKQIRKAASNKTSWLSGAVVCGQCGRNMTTVKGKVSGGQTRIYFTCTGKSYHKLCPGTPTIYAESLEQTVYQAILEVLSTEMNCICKPVIATDPVLNCLRNKRNALLCEEKKIADAVIQNDINSALLGIMNQKALELTKTLTEIDEQIKELQDQVARDPPKMVLRDRWMKATFEEKRGVCRLLLHHIIIDNRGDVEMLWNI